VDKRLTATASMSRELASSCSGAPAAIVSTDLATFAVKALDTVDMEESCGTNQQLEAQLEYTKSDHPHVDTTQDGSSDNSKGVSCKDESKGDNSSETSLATKSDNINVTDGNSGNAAGKNEDVEGNKSMATGTDSTIENRTSKQSVAINSKDGTGYKSDAISCEDDSTRCESRVGSTESRTSSDRDDASKGTTSSNEDATRQMI